MTGIEDVVRRALREQVSRQPAMSEPAGRAIAGAAALRRRQTLLAVGAVVVVLVTVVSGGVALRGRGTAPGLTPSTGTPVPSTSPSASPTVAPSLPAVVLSAIVEDRTHLLAPDGQLFDLSRTDGTPGSAYQTPDGWLVNTFVSDTGTDQGRLWLLRPDGYLKRVVDSMNGGAVVSPDAKRLAWRSGETVSVGHLDDSGAVVTDATAQSPEGFPLLYTGSAVLLGYPTTGGGFDNFDVWVPQRGRYTPTWDRAQATGIVAVFGATADDRWLVGNVLASPGSGSKDTCLARLDPLDQLRVVARACGLPEAREWGSVSPDGHWLAYQSADQAAGRAQATVVDLTTVFQQPRIAAAWPLAVPGVWTGPDTMVAQGADERFRRYLTGRPGSEEVAVVGMPPGGMVELVPKLP